MNIFNKNETCNTFFLNLFFFFFFCYTQCYYFIYRDTERVLVVILPDTKVKDAALRIQHTLIEAFCRENEVKVLKVS